MIINTNFYLLIGNYFPLKKENQAGKFLAAKLGSEESFMDDVCKVPQWEMASVTPKLEPKYKTEMSYKEEPVYKREPQYQMGPQVKGEPEYMVESAPG